jgi:PKD repeat protein
MKKSKRKEVVLLKENKKLYSVAFTSVIFILLLILFSSIVSASTLYVGGKENYKTIQNAVNHAKSGDIIIVNSGTYPEKVNLTSPGLTIKGIKYPKVNGFINFEDYGGFGDGDQIISGFSIMKDGITITGIESGNNVIRNNIFYNCDAILGGDVNKNNTIMNNFFNGGGIQIYGVTASIIGNKIHNAKTGIWLPTAAGESSIAEEISGNNIYDCKVGIDFGDYSEAGKIYNNYFNNAKNIQFESPYSYDIGGVWNISKDKGKNLIGGPNIGGNFWGSPNGSGFSQIAMDANDDGLADQPYNIDNENIDYYPLVKLKLPIPAFSTSLTIGKAPLSVKFIDKSIGSITSRYWNFGDKSTSTSKNPVHKYAKTGKYTVTLTVKNAAGCNTTKKINYITVK